MWKALSLTLALCLLVGCSAESETDGARCKRPPVWKIGEEEPTKNCSLCTVHTWRIYLIQLVECSSRLNDLLLKLENQGYININYMVVNNRDERSQQLHPLLKERLMNITLYAQDLSQPDVWQAVNAEKDDILVYDRCGRLTYHLSLPYTNLSHPHVEEAIRLTYCDGICGECSIENKNHFFSPLFSFTHPHVTKQCGAENDMR
uniref:Selenoprotein P N-terminal domain-containing protein n=1 Tax=Sinocyclocheilus grahami TaxID=75366 RepID=A0A672SBG3_SINGR